MSNYTISEIFELPSKGLIYKGNVNSKVQLRAMTTEEEMLRLAPSIYKYQAICTIIDKCMVEPIGISSYDMHLGDFHFLLHRLRVITYGSSYPVKSICPLCGKVSSELIDLDSLSIRSWEDKSNELFDLTLPQCGRKVVLKYQTPKILDDIYLAVSKNQKEQPENTLNMEYLYRLRSCIDTIDGSVYDPVRTEIFLRKLSMQDTNVLTQAINAINDATGLDLIVPHVCKNSRCGATYQTPFRISDEFFRPRVY